MKRGSVSMAVITRGAANILRQNVFRLKYNSVADKLLRTDAKFSIILEKFIRRTVHTSSNLRHGEYEYQEPKSPDEIVNVTYIDKDGKRHPVKGKIGDNLMYLAHRHEIEMEGACEASLACTTCHVYVLGNYLDFLPEATEKEEDLLDLAPFLRDDSRLGCQIILTKELEGIEVRLPSATRNFYVDGHKPKPH